MREVRESPPLTLLLAWGIAMMDASNPTTISPSHHALPLPPLLLLPPHNRRDTYSNILWKTSEKTNINHMMSLFSGGNYTSASKLKQNPSLSVFCAVWGGSGWDRVPVCVCGREGGEGDLVSFFLQSSFCFILSPYNYANPSLHLSPT